MSEEQLWISEDTIEAASQMDSCCRETLATGASQRLPAPDSGEERQCNECGNLWRAEGTIREYRCGCAFGPDLEHLCKEAADLEARSHELVSEWSLDLLDSADHERCQRRIQDAEREHLTAQERQGCYRDVPERVMFEHSEPQAKPYGEMNG